MSNFHPLEVVGRVSETQLQVGEKLTKMTPRVEGYVLAGVCDTIIWSACFSSISPTILNRFHEIVYRTFPSHVLTSVKFIKICRITKVRPFDINKYNNATRGTPGYRYTPGYLVICSATW